MQRKTASMPDVAGIKCEREGHGADKRHLKHTCSPGGGVWRRTESSRAPCEPLWLHAYMCGGSRCAHNCISLTRQSFRWLSILGRSKLIIRRFAYNDSKLSELISRASNPVGFLRNPHPSVCVCLHASVCGAMRGGVRIHVLRLCPLERTYLHIRMRSISYVCVMRFLQGWRNNEASTSDRIA